MAWLSAWHRHHAKRANQPAAASASYLASRSDVSPRDLSAGLCYARGPLRRIPGQHRHVLVRMLDRLRPGSQFSYLTHCKVRLPVPTGLLHMSGAVGVV